MEYIDDASAVESPEHELILTSGERAEHHIKEVMTIFSRFSSDLQNRRRRPNFVRGELSKPRPLVVTWWPSG